MLAAGFNPSSTYIIYFILSIITVNLGLLLKKQKKTKNKKSSKASDFQVYVSVPNHQAVCIFLWVSQPARKAV